MISFRLTLYASFCTVLLLFVNISHAETPSENNPVVNENNGEQIEVSVAPNSDDESKNEQKDDDETDKKKEKSYRYDVNELNDQDLENWQVIKQLRLQADRLEAEMRLLQAKDDYKLAPTRIEHERLLFQAALEDSRYQQKVAEMVAEKGQLELENSLASEKRLREQSALEDQSNIMNAENTLTESRQRKVELENSAKTAEMEFESTQATHKIDMDTAILTSKVAYREQQLAWEEQANNIPEYLLEPLVDNDVLVMSDRQINMPDTIWPGTAQQVINQINFFNNKNKQQPIYLVFDYCRGGVISEGSQIIQAMRSSVAPVYVVVKAYAGSMAAVITALADRSYALANAAIVHHQMRSYNQGNITEQRQHLKLTEKWAKRLLKPVADKMGLSTADFRIKMYENDPKGNWMEFADDAKPLGWVTHIIQGIRDTSVVVITEADTSDPYSFLLGQIENKQDKSTSKPLPKLHTGDFYYMTETM